MKSTIITPTIGRKLWYWPTVHDLDTLPLKQQHAYVGKAQPFDSTVIYVWNDRSVNLLVTDHAGNQFHRSSITLVQPGDLSVPLAGYACWMPYQTAQAEKQEAAPAPAPAKRHADKLQELQDVAMAHLLSACKPAPAPVRVDYTSEFGLQRDYKRVTCTILPDGRTTACQITLQNGFTVVGLSVAATLEVFDAALGRDYACKEAHDRVQPFIAFKCFEQRHDDELPF